MPENMNINGRKSIHERDAQTPQREDSECEDEYLNESQEQFTTESGGSDFEGFEGSGPCSPEEYTRRERFELSRSVPRTPQRPKPPRLNTTTTKLAYTPESYQPKKPVKIEASSSFFIRTVALLVLASGCVYAYIQQNGKEFPQKVCSYEKLQQEYPQENPFLWRSLKVGIESILNKRTEQPGVYLFVHHGGQHVDQLVKDIAAHSSSCFGQKMHPVKMESEDFIASSGNNDYGEAIEKYKMKIKEGNVILIANLNEIPAEAARALHTICDTHSPIAKDVVIFLTLTIPPIEEGNVESNAEETLINLWGSKLGRNELDPLITRVTDQVIALQS